MKKLSLIAVLLAGCATLQPGADPLVVRVEQAETIGKATLDGVVHVETGEAAFFKTNAPAFYQFAEWLKTPQTVTGNPTNNTLPRGLAMIWSLDQVKLAYKVGSVSSNAVLTALSTLQASLDQANAWLTLSTNNPSTLPK